MALAEAGAKKEKYQELVRELRKVGGNKTCINCSERVRTALAKQLVFCFLNLTHSRGRTLVRIPTR